MLTHLKKWYLVYGASSLAVAHNYWPQVREAICSNPKVSGTAFVGIVVAALLKSSPTVKTNAANPNW